MSRCLGVTLLEILIVIVVIAILASIMLPRFRGRQEQEFAATAASELRTLQAAVESYALHHHSYPAPDAAWQAALTSAQPRLVERTLADPFSASGAQYQYLTSSNGQHYVIFSIGPDQTADILSVSDAGTISGGPDDDIYVTSAR